MENTLSQKNPRQYLARIRPSRKSQPIVVAVSEVAAATEAVAQATETIAVVAEIVEDIAAAEARRRRWRLVSLVLWILVAAGAVLGGAGFWVERTFGKISVDQLLLNLSGGGGEGAGGTELMWGAVTTILCVPLFLTTLMILLVEIMRRAVSRRDGLCRPRLVRGIAAVLALLVPVSGVSIFANAIGLRDYVQAALREASLGTSIADYYTKPVVVSGVDDETSRNLVLIYLESTEDTFADDRLFEKNMLEPVQSVTQGWESIPRLHQYEGGGWTMAGIVSTQCGIPLRSVTDRADNDELNTLGAEGSELESYMPGATCLGDVLADEGYRNVFLGGADARFAGKGAFFSGHGYDEVDDLGVWRGLGETEIRDDWGLSDRRLFERAKDTVTELHEADAPFNLTILTLDTHEGPRVFEYCSWDTDTAMTSITFCSMQQVAGFIDFMRDEGYLEDTAVVIMGDHLKMVAQGGSFWDELHGREGRTIFNRIWTPDGERMARPEIDQLSVYPTILELLGIELADHRAGVGVSALVAPRKSPQGRFSNLNPMNIST
ncbi:sulfatase-like hydrolase/transferase [Leucobacter insecticola]|uniref:Sulfatase-like hydrolase/transferase n=1 Tax=Leucobacter insecticola TaxID=2714934 RepID=A0A6G8FHA9_9MICO|nr:sulfatase-like hydrolase/transferase [Leucobacter insecticola]QIM15850.1 sulfatase-like hydrolase/transferase [Leucobacter insecticola]